MCGITGGWWRHSFQKLENRIEVALDSMRRRGPDDHGYDVHVNSAGVIALGQTRLSIIDLSSGGHQPMHSADGVMSIVFNGEIYNYRELRRELQALGYVFKSDSDTEVLLTAWCEWGANCLSRLVGMFAFAIHDKLKNTLTCVRDPFGIKPFFYTLENGNLMFASEIAALKELKQENIVMDWQRAYDYLVRGDYDCDARTFFRDIKHLLPGHLLSVNLDSEISHTVQRWWRPSIIEKSDISFIDAAQVLREKFLDSIKLHLRSDVPLGAALSGGVDSSSVVCAMRHIEPDLPINTFSYIARGSVISEKVWVDRVNAHVDAKSYQVELSASDLSHDLDDMIQTQGEPFGSTSIYAQYRVFKLAKEHGVTVTLDGQGADELLAGYNGYPGQRLHSLIESGEYLSAVKFLHSWTKWPGRTHLGGLKRLVGQISSGSIYQMLKQLNGNALQPEWLRHGLLLEAGVEMMFVDKQHSTEARGRRVAEALRDALTHNGLPALLRHADRNSMRFSVESRVPFLTQGIAEFVLSLPEQYLISNSGETKSVFREAMRGIVPDEILDRRDKIGFETPEKELLLSMVDTVRVWLSEDLKIPFLNQERLRAEFESIVNGKTAFSGQVWRWVNFSRWHQQMIGSQ